MANDLTDHVNDVTRAPERSSGATGVCSHCLVGNHSLCSGVYCLPLCTIGHPRRPGISGLADQPVVTGRQEGQATDHKPAHRRGSR